MSDFAWLIEAPGHNYLRAHEMGHKPEFVWTNNAELALRFYSKEQADLAMMAIRELDPSLFAFAMTLGMSRPTEHGWLVVDKAEKEPKP